MLKFRSIFFIFPFILMSLAQFSYSQYENGWHFLEKEILNEKDKYTDAALLIGSKHIVTFFTEKEKDLIKAGKLKSTYRYFNKPKHNRVEVSKWVFEEESDFAPKGIIKVHFALGTLKKRINIKPAILYDGDENLLLSEHVFLADNLNGKHSKYCYTLLNRLAYKTRIAYSFLWDQYLKNGDKSKFFCKLNGRIHLSEEGKLFFSQIDEKVHLNEFSSYVLCKMKSVMDFVVASENQEDKDQKMTAIKIEPKERPTPHYPVAVYSENRKNLLVIGLSTHDYNNRKKIENKYLHLNTTIVYPSHKIIKFLKKHNLEPITSSRISLYDSCGKIHDQYQIAKTNNITVRPRKLKKKLNNTDSILDFKVKNFKSSEEEFKLAFVTKKRWVLNLKSILISVKGNLSELYVRHYKIDLRKKIEPSMFGLMNNKLEDQVEVDGGVTLYQHKDKIVDIFTNSCLHVNLQDLNDIGIYNGFNLVAKIKNRSELKLLIDGKYFEIVDKELIQVK